MIRSETDFDMVLFRTQLFNPADLVNVKKIQAQYKVQPLSAFLGKPLTMYKLPESLLVANPINRYLINSPMLPDLTKDADGGLTLYIQNESPGKDKEANWLPAPKGPFAMYMRLYWPAEAALDGSWKQPKLNKVN